MTALEGNRTGHSHASTGVCTRPSSSFPYAAEGERSLPARQRMMGLDGIVDVACAGRKREAAVCDRPM